MTIVEFFDSASTNNIVGALLCRPDRIIFVGNERNKIKRAGVILLFFIRLFVRRYPRRIHSDDGIFCVLRYFPVCSSRSTRSDTNGSRQDR